MTFISRFLSIRGLAADKKGATAIEYALLAAILALGLFGALGGTGGATKSTYEHVHTEYKSATGF